MYTNIPSQVKWVGHRSSTFPENQGIYQDGNSSADNYKHGANKVLWQLNKAPSNKIRHIDTGAVMVANDLAVYAWTPLNMQCSLNNAQHDASCG